MKNLFKKLLILPLLFGIVACNGNGASTPATPSSSTGDEHKDEWVVCFLHNYEGSAGEYTHFYIKDGDKVSAPYQRPTREDYRFTNWYKDAACTEVFDFDNEVITSNVNIYAGWKEVEDPSKGYDITWTRTNGVLYQSTTEENLPTHVDAYTKVSFTITILNTHEGAPIVKANNEQLMPVDGVYSLTVNTRTNITVSGIVLKEVIDPNETVTVPTEFFLTLNGEIIETLVKNDTTMEGVIAEYSITHEFAVDDVVTIVDKNGREFKNWENGGEFVANAPVIVTVPGEYTFYLKVYESRISIWIEKPLDPSFEYMTVYFTNPSNWASVYCYAWVGAGDAYMGQWPGKQMQKDDQTGYYYMENIVIGENIIFNNGSGSQTKDLKVPTNGACLFNGTTWVNKDGSTPENPNPTPTPGPVDPTGEYYTLYFTLPSGWSPEATNPRIHYWGTANTENVNLFELGAESNMTHLEGGTYYLQIDTSVVIDGMIIILDQGSEVKQSIDITTGLPTTAGEYEIVVDWDADWQKNSSDVWCFYAELYVK